MSVKVAYAEENAYASGFGAAEVKYACTPFPATTSGLTMFNFLAGQLKLAGKKAKKTRLHGPTQGATARLTVITGMETPEIVIEQFVQDGAMFRIANGDATLTTIDEAAGSLGPSYAIHIEIPNGTTYDYYDLCGCVLKKYELKGSASGDKPQTEVLTFICYDQVDGVEVTDLGVFPVTQPKIWTDLKATIDTDVITEMTDLTFSVTNYYTNEDVRGRATSFRPFDRIFLAKEYEITVKMQADAAAVVPDVFAETLNDFTVIVEQGFYKATITLMDVDDSNFGEIDGSEPKEVEYSVTLKQGNSVVTVATV